MVVKICFITLIQPRLSQEELWGHVWTTLICRRLSSLPELMGSPILKVSGNVFRVGAMNYTRIEKAS